MGYSDKFASIEWLPVIFMPKEKVIAIHKYIFEYFQGEGFVRGYELRVHASAVPTPLEKIEFIVGMGLQVYCERHMTDLLAKAYLEDFMESGNNRGKLLYVLGELYKDEPDIKTYSWAFL